MVTSRSGGSDHNLGLGADASLRLLPDHYLTAKWAGTFDDADPASATLLSRGHVDASWERRTQRGLAYKLWYERAGADFRPDLGFLARPDFTRVALLANRYTFTDDHPTVRRIWPGMLAFSTFRNGDGRLESGQYAVWLQWDMKAGGGGWIEPKLFRENVLLPFSIGGEVEIPAGDYQLSLLRFPHRGQSADIQVARLRVGTALDARASGNAFVQYNTTTDRLDFNVRLRYAFAEGTDLWLVYNEGLETERDRDLLGIQSPLSVARSLILKYSHTFAF